MAYTVKIYPQEAAAAGCNIVDTPRSVSPSNTISRPGATSSASLNGTMHQFSVNSIPGWSISEIEVTVNGTEYHRAGSWSRTDPLARTTIFRNSDGEIPTVDPPYIWIPKGDSPEWLSSGICCTDGTFGSTYDGGGPDQEWTENASVTSVTARFTHTSFRINLAASPVAGGTVSGGGEFYYGDQCTITATPNSGYRFDHWEDDEGNVYSNNPRTFTVVKTQLYTAYFVEVVTLSLFKFGDFPWFNLTQTHADGKYDKGESCTINVTLYQQTGMTPVWWGWTQTNPLGLQTEPAKFSASQSYTFTITENMQLFAIVFWDVAFKIRTYKATRISRGEASFSLDANIPKPPISLQEYRYFYRPTIQSYSASGSVGIWNCTVRVCKNPSNGTSSSDPFMVMNINGSCGKNYAFLGARKYLFFESYYTQYDTNEYTRQKATQSDSLNNRDGSGNFVIDSISVAQEHVQHDGGFVFYNGSLSPMSVNDLNVDFYFSGPPYMKIRMTYRDNTPILSLISNSSGPGIYGATFDDERKYDILCTALIDTSIDYVSSTKYERTIPMSAFEIEDDSSTRFRCDSLGTTPIAYGETYFIGGTEIADKRILEKTYGRIWESGDDAVCARTTFAADCILVFTFATGLILYSPTTNKIIYGSDDRVLYDG